MKRLHKKLVIAIGVVVFGAGVGITGWLVWPRPTIPQSIHKQLTSTVYLPDKSIAPIKTDTVKYNESEKLLSYVSSFQGATLTVSEQPSPDIFTDVPDSFQKYMNGLHNYATFDSANGTVYLTRPPHSNNKQAAVMNQKGTLMFVLSSINLSEDQWRQLFNNVDVVK